MKLFISYAHIDEFLVRTQIVEILADLGHEPWFDHRLVVGQDWKKQLLDAIISCDAFVYALTPESVKSEWCQWELAQAIEHEKAVIPVLLRQTKFPQNLQILKNIQYVDFTAGATAQATARLARGLAAVQFIPKEQIPQTPPSPIGIPAQAYDSVRNLGKSVNQRRTGLIVSGLTVTLVLSLIIIVYLFNNNILLGTNLDSTQDTDASQTALATQSASAEEQSTLITLAPSPTVTNTQAPTPRPTNTPEPTNTLALNSETTATQMFTSNGIPIITPLQSVGNGRFTNPKWSQNGQLLATGDISLRILDQSFRDVASLNLHAATISNIEWSPDGHYIATGSSDETVAIVDTTNWNELVRLSDHSYFLTDIEWSPNGEMFASSSWDRQVLVYNTTTWELIITIPHDSGVDVITWSPDSTRIATGTIDDSIIRIWNVSTGNLEQELSGTDYEESCWGDENGRVTDVEWNPQNELLATFDVAINKVILWNTETYTPVASIELSDHPPCDLIGRSWPTNLEWAREGNQLLVSWENELRIWEVEDRITQLYSNQNLVDEDNYTYAFDLHPTSPLLVLSTGNTLQTFSLQSLAFLQERTSLTYENSSIFFGDNTRLAAVPLEQGINIIDLSSQAVSQVIALDPQESISAISFDNQGSELAAVVNVENAIAPTSLETRLKVWSLSNAQISYETELGTYENWTLPNTLWWIDPNNFLLAGFFDVQLFNRSSSNSTSYDCGGLNSISISRDGSFLVCVSQIMANHDEQLYMYRNNGEMLFMKENLSYPIAINVESGILAAGELTQGDRRYTDNNIVLIDLESGEELETIDVFSRIGETQAGSAWWSPDGRYLLLGVASSAGYGNRGSIFVLDSQNDYEVSQVYLGHQDSVKSLVWNSEGTLFITTSYDGTLKIWNFAP